MGAVARAEARHSISAAILLRAPLDGGIRLLACVKRLRDKGNEPVLSDPPGASILLQLSS